MPTTFIIPASAPRPQRPAALNVICLLLHFPLCSFAAALTAHAAP